MALTLAELRKRIDALDLELLALLNRRAALAHEVGELKKGEGSVVFRPEREAQVIATLQQANAASGLTPTLQSDSVAFIWREIMSACRALEAPQRVAYLGPAGTFSEEAALRFFGSSIAHVPCANFDEVFQNVGRDRQLPLHQFPAIQYVALLPKTRHLPDCCFPLFSNFLCSSRLSCLLGNLFYRCLFCWRFLCSFFY